MKLRLSDETALRDFFAVHPIGLAGPGTILRDLPLLTAAIGPEGVATKSHRGNLPAAMLSDLNARLTHPLEIHVQRALLRDYPNIAGLFLLLRAMGLAVADKGRVRIDPTVQGRWEALNLTEQYFALLEAWLLMVSDDMLGGSQRFPYFQQLGGNLHFLARQVSDRWKTFSELCHMYGIGGIAAWNAQLQSLFGLVEVRARPLAGRRYSSRAWGMEKARRTPWGDAVVAVVLTFLKVRNAADLVLLEQPADAGFGYLQPAFQPYCPDWQRCFALAEAPTREGTFVFKASLNPRWHSSSAWHRLAVPHHSTLDDLAHAVLQAFAFDDDHLHEFRYRDHLGKTRVYNHAYTDEGPYSTEITVGESGLPLKEVLSFRFDFGDDWRFLLRLERIEPPEGGTGRIVLLESHGKNPEQYPSYE